FFDDTNGSKTTRYGVALDQAITPKIHVGAELSRRDVLRPINRFISNEEGTAIIDKRVVNEKRKEDLHRAYLYWAPTDQLALTAEYFLERIGRSGPPGTIGPNDVTELTTHRLPLGISYFHTSGFFSGMKATYFNQDVESRDRGDSSGTEDFWIIDAAIGYRLPQRFGILTLGAENLLDNEFRFQDTRFNSNEPIPPLLVPDRLVSIKFTLAF
ncbi:MAG: TonB-dependent receptor, partial [Gammaproteobacteria bacterium]